MRDFFVRVKPNSIDIDVNFDVDRPEVGRRTGDPQDRHPQGRNPQGRDTQGRDTQGRDTQGRDASATQAKLQLETLETVWPRLRPNVDNFARDTQDAFNVWYRSFKNCRTFRSDYCDQPVKIFQEHLDKTLTSDHLKAEASQNNFEGAFQHYIEYKYGFLSFNNLHYLNASDLIKY
jgi:hypothetical protein